jgi:hypothetical protein
MTSWLPTALRRREARLSPHFAQPAGAGEAGVSHDQIEQMLVGNPERFFSWD